jgi:outer membrane protein assembly factor BamB
MLVIVNVLRGWRQGFILALILLGVLLLGTDASAGAPAVLPVRGAASPTPEPTATMTPEPPNCWLRIEAPLEARFDTTDNRLDIQARVRRIIPPPQDENNATVRARVIDRNNGTVYWEGYIPGTGSGGLYQLCNAPYPGSFPTGNLLVELSATSPDCEAASTVSVNAINGTLASCPVASATYTPTSTSVPATPSATTSTTPQVIATSTLPPTGTPTANATLTAAPTPTTATERSVAYQVNAAHSGNLADKSLKPPLQKLWALDLGGRVSYPLVVDNTVYVAVANTGSNGTRLYARNGLTGAPVWGPVDLGGTYSWAGIAYENGRVFAVNYSGLMRAFNAKSGALLWATQLAGQSSFTSPPAAYNGVVYVGGAGPSGTLYAVQGSTGSVLWTAPMANGDHSSPSVNAGGVYVSYPCNIYSFAPMTGQLLWHNSSGCSGEGGRTTALHNSKLYVRDSSGGANVLLDAATGNQLGTFGAVPAPAFDGNIGFFLSGGTLRAINQQTNATVWSFTGDGSLTSAPVVVNGVVYVGSSGGRIFALDAATGVQTYSATLPAAVLAPDEHNALMLTGLGAGSGKLIVPASNWLVGFGSVTRLQATPTRTASALTPTSTPGGR